MHGDISRGVYCAGLSVCVGPGYLLLVPPVHTAHRPVKSRYTGLGSHAPPPGQLQIPKAKPYPPYAVRKRRNYYFRQFRSAVMLCTCSCVRTTSDQASYFGYDGLHTLHYTLLDQRYFIFRLYIPTTLAIAANSKGSPRSETERSARSSGTQDANAPVLLVYTSKSSIVRSRPHSGSGADKGEIQEQDSSTVDIRWRSARVTLADLERDGVPNPFSHAGDDPLPGSYHPVSRRIVQHALAQVAVFSRSQVLVWPVCGYTAIRHTGVLSGFAGERELCRAHIGIQL